MTAQETKRGAEKVQQYKIEAKDKLKAALESAGDVIFTDYRGLTVGQITDLRRSLREQQSSLTVVKNSYAERAFREIGVEGTDRFFVGPTALAVSERDGGPAAKVLMEFAKSSTLQVKGGWCGGKLVSGQQVEALSLLPGRSELIAMLMGTIKAPISNLVYALNGVTQKLLRTLVAVRDKKSS